MREDVTDVTSYLIGKSLAASQSQIENGARSLFESNSSGSDK